MRKKRPLGAYPKVTQLQMTELGLKTTSLTLEPECLSVSEGSISPCLHSCWAHLEGSPCSCQPAKTHLVLQGLHLPASTPSCPHPAPWQANWARKNYSLSWGLSPWSGGRGLLTVLYLLHCYAGNFFKTSPHLFSPHPLCLQGNWTL